MLPRYSSDKHDITDQKPLHREASASTCLLTGRPHVSATQRTLLGVPVVQTSTTAAHFPQNLRANEHTATHSPTPTSRTSPSPLPSSPLRLVCHLPTRRYIHPTCASPPPLRPHRTLPRLPHVRHGRRGSRLPAPASVAAPSPPPQAAPAEEVAIGSHLAHNSRSDFSLVTTGSGRV